MLRMFEVGLLSGSLFIYLRAAIPSKRSFGEIILSAAFSNLPFEVSGFEALLLSCYWG